MPKKHVCKFKIWRMANYIFEKDGVLAICRYSGCERGISIPTIERILNAHERAKKRRKG